MEPPRRDVGNACAASLENLRHRLGVAVHARTRHVGPQQHRQLVVVADGRSEMVLCSRQRRAKHDVGQVHGVHAFDVVVGKDLEYERHVRFVRLEDALGDGAALEQLHDRADGARIVQKDLHKETRAGVVPIERRALHNEQLRETATRHLSTPATVPRNECSYLGDQLVGSATPTSRRRRLVRRHAVGSRRRSSAGPVALLLPLLELIRLFQVHGDAGQQSPQLLRVVKRRVVFRAKVKVREQLRASGVSTVETYATAERATHPVDVHASLLPGGRRAKHAHDRHLARQEIAGRRRQALERALRERRTEIVVHIHDLHA
jgi:hypothetical protein